MEIEKQEEEKQKSNLWTNLWPIVLVGLVLGGLIVALLGLPDIVKIKTAEVVLGILLVIGVVLLVVTLSFATAVFKSLGLSDPKSALGLPEGSMQAVIALSLILIFLITSVLLYQQVSEPYTIEETSLVITQDMLDTFPNDTIVYIQRVNQTVNNETLFNVGLKKEKTETSEDIAQQLITTVSTLVVAVAGFYFGSKTVTEARRAVVKEIPPEAKPPEAKPPETKPPEATPPEATPSETKPPEVKKQS